MLGTLTGQKLAYIGDTNNVARSLAVGCGKVGMSLTVATPHGYGYPPKFLDQLQRELPDAQLTVTHDPVEAVRDAAAIYTDVWASMGQESQRTQRKQDFAAYQVNAKLISQAPRTAYFMHCLPARRGEEVTDEVIDGATSIVVQQAANRLHVQKGILAWILAGQR
jgi:ornithine carbamoyltransferase